MGAELPKTELPVLLTITQRQTAEAMIQAIHSQINKAMGMQADIRNEVSVAPLFQKMISQCGELDISVNNARISILKPTEQFRLEELEKGIAFWVSDEAE